MKWLLIVVLSLASAVQADDKKVFTDRGNTGQDYKDQGEYKNDWGGAQVIALGNEEFRMVTFQGGLPGAGWDGEFRNEAAGQRQGEKIVFKGSNGYRAELAEGRITITTDSGGPWTMRKTERKSPTLGAEPPADAVVLFDGSSADAWAGGEMDERGYLKAGCKSQRGFDDFRAHIEFMTPFKPLARGQGRGNSGVYLQDRYEIQVLDSFGLKGKNNECGGIYSVAKPAVNMCLPPLRWQTYDVDFTAPKWDADGNKTENAVVTVKHNGVTIHENVEVPRTTTAAGRKEGSSPGPFQLQDHGNPVFYRNIWVVPK